MAKKKKKWSTEDADALLNYNGLDTAGTARVARVILQGDGAEWRTPRVQKLYEIHRQLSIIGAELHTTGFYVMEANRRALLKQLRMLSTRRHNELVEVIGGKKANPAFKGTDDDMRAMLYKRHAKAGIECFDIEEPDTWDEDMWTNEEHHTLSVDKEALLRIFVKPGTPNEVRDAISHFWRAKAPNKAITTWVDSKQVLSKIGDDGRMRSDWNSAGTETMRWAGELMTLPEDKDDEQMGGRLPNIRLMYGATPGWELVHWDWSQQEIRMYYAIYKDPQLKRGIDAGNIYVHDAHQWFAPQLEKEFGPKWREVKLKLEWKNGYRQTKVVHLGSQYLAGPATIWVQGLLQDRTLKFHTVKMLNQSFLKTYEVSVANAKAEHERVYNCGYSEGRILHGRRQYPAPPPITETCNYPVQRTAGEMGALTMIDIWKKIKRYKVRAKMLTNEHDAGTMDCHPKDKKTLANIIRDTATGPWEIEGVKHDFPVSVHYGTTWAEACEEDKAREL